MFWQLDCQTGLTISDLADEAILLHLLIACVVGFVWVCMRRSEDSSVESTLSFHPVGPRL